MWKITWRAEYDEYVGEVKWRQELVRLTNVWMVNKHDSFYTFISVSGSCNIKYV